MHHTFHRVKKTTSTKNTLIIMTGKIRRLYRRILSYSDVIVCNSFSSNMVTIRHLLYTDKLPLAPGNTPVFTLRARVRWIMIAPLSIRRLLS